MTDELNPGLGDEHGAHSLPETTFYVDIPTEGCIDNSDGAYKNVATFHSKQEAIEYARKHFGANEKGMVQLVTGG
jgi:hypothetical protein